MRAKVLLAVLAPLLLPPFPALAFGVFPDGPFGPAQPVDRVQSLSTFLPALLVAALFVEVLPLYAARLPTLASKFGEL